MLLSIGERKTCKTSVQNCNLYVYWATQNGKLAHVTKQTFLHHVVAEQSGARLVFHSEFFNWALWVQHVWAMHVHSSLHRPLIPALHWVLPGHFCGFVLILQALIAIPPTHVTKTKLWFLSALFCSQRHPFQLQAAQLCFVPQQEPMNRNQGNVILWQ